MSLTITLRRAADRLARPYPLSFATVETFEGYYVVVEGNGRVGLGEATPLTGYNHETPASVRAALGRWRDAVAGGADPWAAARDIHPTDPFAASGALCALETWRDGMGVYAAEVPAQLLTAFVPGATPEAAASDAAALTGAGYRALKLKIGRDPVDSDIARVAAVCSAAPADTEIRLDANQALSVEGAGAMVQGLAGLPVALLEQPFVPEAWEPFAELARLSAIPLMLDESIWTAADVERAATVGAKYVKLKLGKHQGMGDVEALVGRARTLGLGVVFGNGVQTGVGNHLELLLHHRLGIETASEGNGFAKAPQAAIRHRITTTGGCATSGGLVDPMADLARLPAE